MSCAETSGEARRGAKECRRGQVLLYGVRTCDTCRPALTSVGGAVAAVIGEEVTAERAEGDKTNVRHTAAIDSPGARRSSKDARFSSYVVGTFVLRLVKCKLLSPRCSLEDAERRQRHYACDAPNTFAAR